MHQRLLLWVLVLLLVLMPKCPFEGCSVTPRGTAAFNKHVASCPKKNASHTENVQAVTAHHEDQLAAVREAEQALAAHAQTLAQDIPDVPMRDPTPPPPTFWPVSGRPQRSSRARRKPMRFEDEPPAPPPPADVVIPERSLSPEPGGSPPSDESQPPKWYRTPPNAHGVYKVYPRRPTHDPDNETTLEDLCLSPELLRPEQEELSTPARPTYFPFTNHSRAWLMSWFLETPRNTLAGLKTLVEKVILRPSFKVSELADNFDPNRELHKVDKVAAENPDELPKGWKNGSVKIKLPPPPGQTCSEEDAPEIEIDGILYRPLLEVMEESFQGPAFKYIHTTPFSLRWDPTYNPAAPDTIIDPADVELNEFGLPVLPKGHQDVYGEIYTSPTMLEPQTTLPEPPAPCIETVIAGFMFWSDATHLANFGSAALWPLYTFFGNISKYIRCKPTARACNHQAYFPSLPDWVKDRYKECYDVANIPKDVLTHLKRELMHAIWDQLLLTPEFLHAYKHGHPIKCFDKIWRLIVPRFLTYSADYPEKVLLALIKANGGCPCPRCYVPKEKIQDLGTKADAKRRETNSRKDTKSWWTFVNRAREFIFDIGRKITSPTVERLLKPFSWVPTRNAFNKIKKFADPTFNLFKMLVPDVLHELELGVIKAVWIHILRIIEATTKQLDALDIRFRKVPTYGRSVIRRFKKNVSDLKQFAARDYEDVIQCSMPVLDGLLVDGQYDEYNELVLDVCFDLLTFHAYAKLRLHTTSTVALLRNSLVTLGKTLRRFHQKTIVIVTVELPSEYRRRMRAKAKKGSKNTDSAGPAIVTTKLEKPFNLNTPKIHFIGDYADAIVTVGTLDGVSTGIGEAAHHGPKLVYARSNRRNFEPQLAQDEHRKRIAQQTTERMEAEENPPASTKETPADPRQNLPEPEDDPLPDVSPNDHHQIGQSRRTYWTFGQYPVYEDVPMRVDPAYKDFGRKLKSHIRARLLDEDEDTEYTNAELNDVLIERDRIFTHALMRVNFTTYDMQRDQDIISPRTHCNFMVRALPDAEDDHPYGYGRGLQIMHLVVQLRGSLKRAERMEVIWTRFYARDTTYKSGWKHKRLHRLEFLPQDNPGAFGFVNPRDIIRAVHLIPHFRYGRTNELLSRSVARQFDDEEEDEDADWRYYCLNWFVDRDMVMRYHEDAVGHRVVEIPHSESANVPVTQEEGDEEDLRLDVERIVAQLNELPPPKVADVEGPAEVAPEGEDDDDEDDGRRQMDEDDDLEDEDATEKAKQGAVVLVGDDAELDAAGLARW